MPEEWPEEAGVKDLKILLVQILYGSSTEDPRESDQFRSLSLSDVLTLRMVCLIGARDLHAIRWQFALERILKFK